MDGCFTVAVAVPITRPFNIGYFPRIRRLSIMEQRRSRVNVSGVVTPSPVGPAMENDRYASPPSPKLDGPHLISVTVDAFGFVALQPLLEL